MDFDHRVCYPKWRMAPRGEVSISTLLLVVAAVGAVYALVIFSPAVVDNFEVSKEVAAAVNRADRQDDDQLRDGLVDRLSRVGTHWELQHDGTWLEVEGLGVDRDNVIVDRNTVKGEISVRVEYERKVKLKPFTAWTSLSFSPEREGAVSR